MFMDNFIITPKLKDELLGQIVNIGSMRAETNINSTAKELNTTSDIVEAIFDQFEEMGFLTQQKFLGGNVLFLIKANAHDFYNHGGFQAQEEILKANIEKLSQELDLLSKQLSPDLLEKANKLAGISSAILSALSLFKS